MAGWNEQSGAVKAGIGGIAAAVVVAISAWAVLQSRAPEPAVEVAASAAQTPTEPALASASPAEVAPQTAPSIDVLRVAPDGTVTLAGRASPLALVGVLIDGAEVTSIAVDGSGQFASVFSIEPSDKARLLTLQATLADGAKLASTQSVAIAPVVLPEAAETDVASAEGEAPAALILTETGAQVLQPAEPVPEALAAEVSLDVIAYTAEGGVQLGGKGTADALLQIYLDNAELAAVTVGPDGTWSQTVQSIAPGIYTLRIDQMDDVGKVTSRLETPFKRETLEALAAAAAPIPEPEAVQTAQAAAAEPAVPAAEPSVAQPAAAEPAAPAEPAAAEPVMAADVEQPQVATSETDAATTAPAGIDGAVTTAAAATEAPASDTAPAASAGPITITVQPGFTLWAIAKESFGSGIMYVQVYEANKDKIKDPNLIYPGQVLSVPASP